MLSTLDMYLQSLTITREFLSCIGLDVYRDKFKINWVLIVLVSDVIVYIISNGYSVFIYRNDFDRCMFCLITWSLGFMVRISLEYDF